jgi:ATP-dependent DNA helicase RecQ
VLVEVASRRPRSHQELLDVSGVGEMKLQRFGEAILGIVAEHEAS